MNGVNLLNSALLERELESIGHLDLFDSLDDERSRKNTSLHFTAQLVWNIQ